MRANSSTLQVARTLLHSAAVRAAFPALCCIGCVIPPSLSVDNQDAGVNSPPAIVSVRSDQQELDEPGPVLFDQGTGSLNLTLLDTDVNDTLYVRVFVNYYPLDPTPARAQCVAAAAMTAQRSATCDLTGLCQNADVGQTVGMQVVVFDRQPLDSGSPTFKAMPMGGLSTDRFYYLKCQARSP